MTIFLKNKHKYILKGTQILICLFAFSYNTPLSAKVLFEGYYKLKAGQSHIGYVIQSYSYEEKSKNFVSQYFLFAKTANGEITESLKARCDQAFQPISYGYTSLVGKQVKIIDASFKGNKMTTIVGNGKTSKREEKTLKKGVFLASFLNYVMLNNGLAKGKKFVYTAIAEEDAAPYGGEALVKEEASFKKLQGFRILNNFKNSKFVSIVAKNGDTLGTTSILQNVSTELMKKPVMATQGFTLNVQNLKTIFGRVPQGSTNPISKLADASGSLKQKAPSLEKGTVDLNKGLPEKETKKGK